MTDEHDQEAGFVAAIEAGRTFIKDVREPGYTTTVGGDWTSMLVFADWLEDRGDPRADGYRVMGGRGLRPNKCAGFILDDGDLDEEEDTWVWYTVRVPYEETECVDPASDLPAAWYLALERTVEPGEKIDYSNFSFSFYETHYTTAGQALNAAALAWALMSAEEKALALEQLTAMRVVVTGIADGSIPLKDYDD